jgi:hypothetical protein
MHTLATLLKMSIASSLALLPHRNRQSVAYTSKLVPSRTNALQQLYMLQFLLVASAPPLRLLTLLEK